MQQVVLVHNCFINSNTKTDNQTLAEALKEAFNHKGFILLVFGFFVVECTWIGFATDRSECDAFAVTVIFFIVEA